MTAASVSVHDLNVGETFNDTARPNRQIRVLGFHAYTDGVRPTVYWCEVVTSDRSPKQVGKKIRIKEFVLDRRYRMVGA